MLSEITQIIQVDLDLKYKANIRDLFEEFNNFQEGAVIGIAREMQPVYRYSRVPRVQVWGWGLSCLLFNSDQSLEQNLGRNSISAVIPAEEFNLKLPGQSEQIVQCGVISLFSHTATRLSEPSS